VALELDRHTALDHIKAPGLRIQGHLFTGFCDYELDLGSTALTGGHIISFATLYYIPTSKA
jgi:hypothetical protein